MAIHRIDYVRRPRNSLFILTHRLDIVCLKVDLTLGIASKGSVNRSTPFMVVSVTCVIVSFTLFLGRMVFSFFFF